MEKKEKINLKRLTSVIEKNGIAIIMLMVLFILCGFFYSYNMVIPKYKSTSTILLVSNNLNNSKDSVTQTDVNLNKNLISTYGKILKSNNVLEKVIANTNVDITLEELYQNIQIEAVGDTQMIKICVINENPTVANKIAEELNIVFVDEIQQIYKINNINIIDKASLEFEPYNVNHVKDIIISILLGLVFISLLVMIIYVVDTTVKIEQDIEEYVGLKVVGAVPIYKAKIGEDKSEIIVHNNSKSSVVEALKTIRTNISFSINNTQNAIAVLFTSCNSGEGKSWTAANIAVAYAQMNKNVIIIDADMRKGRQAQIFQTESENGLSNCLREINSNEDYEILEKYIKETNIPKVHIMTTGLIPVNPSELLLSNKMADLVRMLRCMYDVIIIDGTPCNLVSDCIPVSRLVDTTILVAESKKTKIEDLREIVKTINNANGKLDGAILNKKEIKSKEYGYGYYGNKLSEMTEPKLDVYTVRELIEKRREYIEEPVIEEKNEEEKNEEEKITTLIEKISKIEENIAKIPQINETNLLKTVEQIQEIYNKEIDREQLAESIRNNIIRNEVIAKIEEGNLENRNFVEEKITQISDDNKAQIEMFTEENKRQISILDNRAQIRNITNEIYKINLNDEIIIQNLKEEIVEQLKQNMEFNKNIIKQQIEKITEDNKNQIQLLDNSNQMNEIMNELKKINDRYDKLAERVNNQINQDNFTVKPKKTRNKVGTTKDNVIEISEVKEKLKKKKEILVDYGAEIEYKQLVDLAVYVYDIKQGINEEQVSLK